MSLYYELFNQSGRPLAIENCHQGLNFTDGGNPDQMGPGWCPYNWFRTSGDVVNLWDRVISNLMTVAPFLQPPKAAPKGAAPLSRPGCWAYPDMLEVGCDHGRHGDRDPGLSETEAATHFAAWAIVSSPLILSHDVNNATIMDAVWPIISNKEAIAVNQAWAGHSGSAFYRSPNTVTLGAVNHAAVQKGMGLPQLAALGPTVAPQHEYYYKRTVALFGRWLHVPTTCYVK